ncbi:MAG TPA: RNA methyltransferase [Bacteroidota bacterium]
MITRQEIKRFASLSFKKFRDESGLFLVEGSRGVHEAIGSGVPLQVVVHAHDFADTAQGSRLLDALRGKHARLEAVSARDLAALSDTVHAQGIVAVVRKTAVAPEEVLSGHAPRTLIVALDAVADPGNLGSILRTCDWFGADGVLLGRNCVDLYNPKVVRATMGSIFHLRIAEGVDLGPLAARAREGGFLLAVAEARGETPLPQAPSSGKLIVVVGNEARGVSEEIGRAAVLHLAIPRFGKAESLNVGVACGIILAALRLGR